MANLRIILKSIVAFTNLGLSLSRARGDKAKLTAAGVKFRQYFEEIGGVYVKFGQILALRREMLPAEVCDELRKLLDEGPQFAFSEVNAAIKEDLGATPNVLFSNFSQ